VLIGIAAVGRVVVQINQSYPQAGLFVIVSMVVLGIIMGVIKVFF